MNISCHHFSLDLDRQSTMEYVHVRMGDTARGFSIGLMESGTPYEIGDETSAAIFAVLPDGTYMTDDCEISENRIVYTIPAAMTAAAGTVRCNLNLTESTAAICSPEFLIVVDEINASA